MADIETVLDYLLFLAQIAIAVVALDAVLGFYMDLSFLSGFLKNFAYLGAAVGFLDQVYWLVTSRIEELGM
jgi:hypothetical protein